MAFVCELWASESWEVHLFFIGLSLGRASKHTYLLSPETAVICTLTAMDLDECDLDSCDYHKHIIHVSVRVMPLFAAVGLSTLLQAENSELLLVFK
jgi:hypothetical protein